MLGDHWLMDNRRRRMCTRSSSNPPIRQDGNSIHIDYVNLRNISVDYEITVPANTTVRTRSGSGDQTVEGTQGNVDTQTGSGDVKLANLTGEIHLQTGSGNIRARADLGHRAEAAPAAAMLRLKRRHRATSTCTRDRETSPLVA